MSETWNLSLQPLGCQGVWKASIHHDNKRVLVLMHPFILSCCFVCLFLVGWLFYLMWYLFGCGNYQCHGYGCLGRVIAAVVYTVFIENMTHV